MTDEQKRADEAAAILDPYPHISAGARVLRDVHHKGERFVVAVRDDRLGAMMIFWYMRRAADGVEYGEAITYHPRAADGSMVPDEHVDRLEAEARALIDRGFE